MRRTSAKTLSLAISLLLAISVLFSLSLPVWAETETVPGDLNGDTLVNAEDIAILEAVLDGSQADAADGKYDISGNKMVDSKDLIVLKNLADPSAPALADKLADGITDDALTLVASVEGGVLQSAVVRGNSTKALELNGNTLTVRFAKVQNWSSKGILEMDTLWVSGSQEVTVSLLDADGDVLGTAGTASAKDAGWSRIRVPLSGVADKAEIGGFTVTVSADAHMYMDNLLVDISDEYKITRAEMENALVEMAWNWYFKGSAYEYDSVSLNSLEQHKNRPLSGYSGGKSRLTLFPTLEDATSHSSVFTVCSGFAYDMYLTALGYPILGSKLNSLTMTFWRNSSYYPGNVRDAEGAYDMAILRWHDMGQGTVYYEYDEQFSNYYKDENGNIVYNNWYDKAAVKEFFENYEENFRPGDIIVSDHPGHTIIYIGNGMVMDVNGGRFNPITDKMEGLGGKYDMTTGVEKGEAYGCVSYRSFAGYFLTPNGAGKTWLDRRLDYPENGSGKLLESGTLEHNHLVVIRPLNLLTIDDGDNDPSNDKLNPEYKLNTGLLKYQLEHDVSHEVKTSGYHIDEVTQTRLNYPGMNIDRTVNITPYGTAVKGDTITYTVAITNNSNDAQYVAFKGDGYQPKAYEGLTVVEHIPANTVLTAAPGATVEGDTLTWKVTVPAGETLKLTYTVKVTGEIGEKIVCGGGWVNNIPSNTITNVIGGTKLSDPCLEALTGLYNTGADSWDIDAVDDNGTRFAEKLYKAATGKTLPLPEVQEIMDIFFSEYKYTTSGGYYLHNSNVTRYMYTLRENPSNAKYQTYFDMLVPGYYGGLWCYTDEYNGEARINELRAEYLEPGDILIYMDLTPSTNDGATSQSRVVEGYTVLVYMGKDCYASLDSEGNLIAANDAVCRTSAFAHDLFVCLRPSQAVEDLCNGDSYTVTWVNADGAILETDENVLPGTIPSFEGDTPTMEADGEKEYTFAGWTPAVCVVTGDKTYTAVYTHRDLTDGKLTDAELNILANITPEAVKADITSDIIPHLGNVAPWIYRQAGINYNAIATSGTRAGQIQSTYYTATEFFSGNSAAGWKIKDTINAPYKTMLVTNAYGGEAMVNAPAFDINYLQVGDIFCAAFDKAITGASATYYYTYLYQGNGKFLLISADSAVYQLEDVLNTKYADTQLGWSYFYVIRPENYNGAIRDITLRNLTDAEKYALSRLETGSSSQYVHTNVPACYKAVGITLTMEGKLSQEAVRNKLFNSSSPRVPIAAADATAIFYHKMAIPCYGGSYLPYELSVANAVAGNLLEIGDIVTGSCPCTYVDADGETQTKKPYFTALYQGEGKFLLNYAETYDIEAAAYVIKNVSGVSAAFIDDLNPYYYYTLRPEMLAAETQETYTVTWVNDDGSVLETDQTAAFTLPAYDGGTPVKAPDAQYTYTFVGWDSLFTSVNRDVTYTAVYKAEARSYTITWKNGSTVLETDEGVPYGTIPAYNGKRPYNKNEKVGFAGWDKEITAVTGDVTYTATFTALRDMTSGGLTDAEKAVISSLTLTDWSSNVGSRALENVIIWVYKEAGIDITSAYGYQSRSNAQISNTLSGASAIAKDYYTKIAVAGSYGNNVIGVGTDDLQIGDIFAGLYYIDLNGTSTTMYHAAVYLGKDEQGKDMFLDVFDKINSAGTGKTAGSAIASFEDIESKYTEDGFATWSYRYVLRPSQLSIPYTVTWVNADGTVLETDTVPYGAVPTYNGEEPTRTAEGYTYTFEGWDKEPTAAVKNATYTATYSYVRELTAHRLTDAELDILASITPDDVKESLTGTNLDATGPWVYRQANITYSSTVGGLATVYSTATKFFSGSSGSQTWSIKAAAAGYQSMLVVSAYGGRHMQNAPAFDLNTLQVGDMFCGMYTYGADNKNIYATYLYQGEGEDGEGKFLLLNKATSAVFTLEEVLSSTYTHTDGVAYGWGCYYVLRPENCILRDPSSKELTDAEIHAISKLTPNNLKGLPTGKLYGYIGRIYNEVGIDLDLAGKTASDAFNLLFYTPSGSSYYIPKPASTDEVVKRYQTMLTDCYGGGNFETDVKLSESELQVGDVFVARADYAENDNYWSGVYQDDGNFLMYYWDSTKAGKHEVVSISTLESNYDFHYYFVLRPNNLAN